MGATVTGSKTGAAASGKGAIACGAAAGVAGGGALGCTGSSTTDAGS